MTDRAAKLNLLLRTPYNYLNFVNCWLHWLRILKGIFHDDFKYQGWLRSAEPYWTSMSPQQIKVSSLCIGGSLARMFKGTGWKLMKTNLLFLVMCWINRRQVSTIPTTRLLSRWTQLGSVRSVNYPSLDSEYSVLPPKVSNSRTFDVAFVPKPLLWSISIWTRPGPLDSETRSHSPARQRGKHAMCLWYVVQRQPPTFCAHVSYQLSAGSTQAMSWWSHKDGVLFPGGSTCHILFRVGPFEATRRRQERECCRTYVTWWAVYKQNCRNWECFCHLVEWSQLDVTGAKCIFTSSYFSGETERGCC